MARPRKWEDDAERRQAQNDRRKAERASVPSRFTGVDGEGTGRWKDHRYVLLGVGDRQIASPDGFSFSEMMGHLYSCFQTDPTTTYAGFFLGYDFTQWFRKLPEERASMLLTAKGRAARSRKVNPRLGPFPVRWEGWEFDILGMKRFKLRREGDTSWMYINDAGPFFQASLMSVIDPRKWTEPVVTEEEYAILEQGKAERDSADLDSRMQAYNALENTVLARLLGRTDQGLREAGIRLKRNQWFGPGQAAQAWLTKIGAPTRDMASEMFQQYEHDGMRDQGNTPLDTLGGLWMKGYVKEQCLRHIKENASIAAT